MYPSGMLLTVRRSCSTSSFRPSASGRTALGRRKQPHGTDQAGKPKQLCISFPHRVSPLQCDLSLSMITVEINIKDVGVKRHFDPSDTRCSALYAPAIFKTFVIRSFFFEKWLLTHVFGGSQGQKFSCKQACVELLTF